MSSNLAIIFPDYADQNYFTIQEANSDTIKKRYYNESEVIDVDSSYNNLISFLIGVKVLIFIIRLSMVVIPGF